MAEAGFEVKAGLFDALFVGDLGEGCFGVGAVRAKKHFDILEDLLSVHVVLELEVAEFGVDVADECLAAKSLKGEEGGGRGGFAEEVGVEEVSGEGRAVAFFEVKEVVEGFDADCFFWVFEVGTEDFEEGGFSLVGAPCVEVGGGVCVGMGEVEVGVDIASKE